MPMEKTFTPAEAEARISARWDAANAFAAGAAKRRDEAFCVMIPPPNVTGSLHAGHAFNNTLQDILVRWHRMRGFDTLWQVGTDHAGIATQMVTEREMALNQEPDRRTMGREAFLARVWQQKVKSRGTIIGQLKRLGASCDWSREAFTMGGAAGDPDAGKGSNFHDAVIKVFVEMYNKGLIYRGKRLVNWDPHFETAISDLEVENSEVDGHMWHFKYPLAGGATYRYVEKDADGAVVVHEVRDYISIATTRPETMLGDGAVAVHPSDERYAPIVGMLCEIPVGPKEHRRLIPIITDEYPDPTFGSGAVKITGAHDFNDYAVAKRGGIPCYRLMDTRAQMRADGAPYADVAERAQAIAGGAPFTEAEVDALNLVPDHLRGLDRFAARARVVDEITAEGLAVMTRADDPRLGKAATKPAPAPEPGPLAGATVGGEAPDQVRGGVDMVPLVEAKKIMQPFGDRSKVVIEPMLTDQWFVDAAKIVGPALDAVRDGRVKILPESGEKTYYHWLENIEPWCISRQLWWGHQIPVWYGPRKLDDGSMSFEVRGRDTSGLGIGSPNQMFCAPTEDLAIEMAEQYYGRRVGVFSSAMDAWIGGRSRGVQGIYRDPDVLDTWFSSGLWPIGTLGWPEPTEEMRKYFPTSTLITGADILFFWVARMMMMQLAVVNEIPFREVYLHGLVRDAKGKKMSKSVGNVVDPLDIIDEFGADALRFTNAAMASLGGVLKLDTQRFTGYRNFTTKLWNATRFAEMNGVWEGHTTHAAPPTPQATVNRWILSETARVRAEVDEALAAYRFNDAANALYAFVWGKVCDWYVEFAKPLLADGATAGETRTTMAWVLDQCFVLLHPIMPFITEELWSLTGTRDTLLCHQPWPEYGAELVDGEAMREMRWVIGLIEGVRSARAQMGVPVGLHLPVVMTEMDDRGRAAWGRNVALINRLARLGEMTEGAAPKGSVTIPVEGGGFALPLAGVIDVGSEQARLAKALAKLDKDMAGLNARLGNPKFIASAAEDVVLETRDTLERAEEEAGKLRAALARLAELG